MVDWMNVGRSGDIQSDVRIFYNAKRGVVEISIRRNAWATKLHRGDKIAVGFVANNDIPVAIYFAMSSSGYSVARKDKGGTVGIRIQASKISEKYPRLKLSEIQGEYMLREDKAENAYYISLGAKSY